MGKTRTRSGELILGIFKILFDEPDGLPSTQVLARLEEEVQPTEREKKEYLHRPGVRRYERNARFATINSSVAGWLEKNHGHWSLTDEGRKVYNSITDPEEFYLKSREEYRRQKGSEPREETDADGENEKNDTVIPFVTLEVAVGNAWREIEKHLSEIDPYVFQDVVAALLGGMGHHVEWVAPRGSDGGVDIHAATGGVAGRRIKVQVKRQQSTITVKEIGSFRDKLKEGDTGLYVSTGGFTRDAAKDARDGQRHLILIDGKRFFDLWVSHYEKIPEEHRRLLPIKLVAFYDPPQ